MSKRSSKRASTIEYDVSEWDADLERPRQLKRSNSVDLLEELRKSKKVHSNSSVAFARFPEHYNETVVTHVNQSPGPTFTRSFRYGKEAKKRECHDWKRRPTSSFTDRAIQCCLKVDQRNTTVQCMPPTREMNVQTHKFTAEFLPVKHETKDKGLQCTRKVENNYDDLLALIKGLKNGPSPGAHTPEGLLQQVGSSLAELLAQLRKVHRQTDVIDGKEDELLAEVRKLKAGGPDISLDQAERLLEEILRLLHQMTTSADHEALRKLFVSRMGELLKVLASLQQEHSDIINAIRRIKPGGCSGSHVDEDYLKRIMSFLEEIYEYIHEEEVVEVERVAHRVLYDGQCRCTDITTSTMSKAKNLRGVLHNLCQRCVNDSKGRTFVQSLSLPLATTVDIVNILGKMIECVERDDDFNLTTLIRDFNQHSTGQWQGREYQRTFEALFHLSLLRCSKKCSLTLASFVDVKMMLKSMSGEEHRYAFPDYVRDAVKSQNVDVLKKLFENMEEATKKTVVNSPLVEKGVKIFPMFEAVRQGDVEAFRYLVVSGASLDVVEDDRSVIHELIWVTHTRLETPKFSEWNKAMVGILGVIYEFAGSWWERQMLHADWTGCTESSRVNALRYLFSLQNHSGLNPLQFAARYGTPDIIKKIVCSVPYEFTPDPLEFGHDNGFKGYIVDQIESRLARTNHSVLERMILRDPMDGARVMAIEPFRSMINDKWKRFRIFYGIWFIMYFCYMLVFTVCAINRPVNATSLSDMYKARNDFARLAGEIFIIVCLPLFFYGEIRDLFRMGWVTPRPWLWVGTFRITNFFFVLACIAVVVLRLLANPGEDIALAIALLFGWINTLEFLGASKRCGMFAIVTHRAFVGDIVLRFFIVWVLALAGTSTATFVAYQASPHQILPDFPNGTFWNTPYSLTKVTFALLDADYATQARDSAFGIIIFLAFIFIMNFLLFNLLIAMLVDTYTRTRKKVEASWMWTKASYALLMDRRLPNFLCITYEDNQGQGLASVAPTVLRYLTRLDRRRNRDGSIMDLTEHVVLVPNDDSPKLEAGRLADLVITTPPMTPRTF